MMAYVSFVHVFLLCCHRVEAASATSNGFLAAIQNDW
jgi:hypothetical protein